MKKILTFSLFVIVARSYASQPINFDQIYHWTGEGPNRAALAIRFAETDQTLVWGYRWGDEVRPTGEDMMKAICGKSDKLVMLTQLTGQYGSTLCGLGYGDTQELLDRIWFDFDMAKDYEWINFDYYQSSSFFGQKEAPGDNTPTLCQQAIYEAKTTHVIQHPIDYKNYGYPAYDYDCWKIREKGSDNLKWLSGWYEGYWSYWLGNEASSEWQYSGTGFSGRTLTDGAIDAWTYTVFETPGIGGFGEGTPPAENPADIIYVQEQPSVNVEQTMIDERAVTLYFTLSGQKLTKVPTEPGIYIRKNKNKTTKFLIK